MRAYSQAYLSGDGAKTFGMLSARCQQRVGRDQIIAATAGAKAQYGPQPIATLAVDTLAGTLARVTYTYSTHSLDQTSEPWVREDGAWHEDDC